MSSKDTLSNKPHLALLPGLDGTGQLFYPIIPFLEPHFEIHLVQYDDQVSLDEFVECAGNQLPDDVPVSLVAESFSGPIAISLLARNGFDFRAAVLSATFCRSPMPLFSHMWKYVPRFLFGSNPANRMFLDFFVMGDEADSDLRSRVHELLEEISPDRFQNRICLANEINVCVELEKIEVPLLYIQATRDHIVFPGSASEVMKHAKNLEIARVGGPHMILQTQPENCSKLIIDHITVNSGQPLLRLAK